MEDNDVTAKQRDSTSTSRILMYNEKKRRINQIVTKIAPVIVLRIPAILIVSIYLTSHDFV